MNLQYIDNSIVIDFQGLVISFKMTDPNLKIKKELDIHIKADNLVSEIQNEIDMLPSVVVSGNFVTGAFYGVNKDGAKIFISRDTVNDNPKIFSVVNNKVKLPFYSITNRYSVNSVTKQYYSFSKVFESEEEMLKIYYNTINYLKVIEATSNK
jgi:hypothetical protein